MELVIDRSSLISLQRYYPFDKYEDKQDYINFKNFFKDKFRKREIVIIDKVDEENIFYIRKKFDIDNSLIEKTENKNGFLTILEEVSKNENNLNPHSHKRSEQKEVEKRVEMKKADLSLVAYCIWRMKQPTLEVRRRIILVTEETRNENYNKKVFKKIPNICKNYEVECISLPELIFKFYKEEIKLRVEVKK